MMTRKHLSQLRWIWIGQPWNCFRMRPFCRNRWAKANLNGRNAVMTIPKGLKKLLAKWELVLHLSNRWLWHPGGWKLLLQRVSANVPEFQFLAKCVLLVGLATIGLVFPIFLSVFVFSSARGGLKTCFKKLDLKNAHLFLEKFWGLPKCEQDSFAPRLQFHSQVGLRLFSPKDDTNWSYIFVVCCCKLSYIRWWVALGQLRAGVRPISIFWDNALVDFAYVLWCQLASIVSGMPSTWNRIWGLVHRGKVWGISPPNLSMLFWASSTMVLLKLSQTGWWVQTVWLFMLPDVALQISTWVWNVLDTTKEQLRSLCRLLNFKHVNIGWLYLYMNPKRYIDLYHIPPSFMLKSLPCRFIMRGRSQRGEDPEVDLEALEIDPEEVKSWLDRPGKGVVWDMLQAGEKPITKYLAPGTVADLYTHYQATRQLWGAVAVSHLDIHCSPVLNCFWFWIYMSPKGSRNQPSHCFWLYSCSYTANAETLNSFFFFREETHRVFSWSFYPLEVQHIPLHLQGAVGRYFKVPSAKHAIRQHPITIPTVNFKSICLPSWFPFWVIHPGLLFISILCMLLTFKYPII